jgi:hypothetical protein
MEGKNFFGAYLDCVGISFFGVLRLVGAFRLIYRHSTKAIFVNPTTFSRARLFHFVVSLTPKLCQATALQRIFLKSCFLEVLLGDRCCAQELRQLTRPVASHGRSVRLPTRPTFEYWQDLHYQQPW